MSHKLELDTLINGDAIITANFSKAADNIEASFGKLLEL